ncbi:nucleoside phosphorylase-I family protein [Helicobacter mesocricetorum]|uniref:purine-nucleoside phosphorylase n=1 Tax=Helicobacter mesocricetorum TaxID=87012 RepID=UPI000CF13B01|nr:purine-nucleoside phosphorylase [Helicobacter mesocricetorum]
MFYCAGDIETFTFAKPIGVGLIQSSIQLTYSIYRDKPNEIIFIGTCGCYDDSKNILEIFESRSASNIELSFLQQQSYTPLDNFITLEENVSHETLSKLTPHKIINSSNYISTDTQLTKNLLKLGIAYENMEFFSVLQVAKYFNLPAFGIFCSTNHIHKDAHKEFLANHKIAMRKIESYIKAKQNG